MTIISSTPDEVAKAIDEQVGRGLTILNGYGYYTREEKMFYVVISKHKFHVQNVSLEILTKMLVIHDVRDVYGNGFLDE